MLRAALTIIGLAAMGYAALHLLDLSGTGFPDGYISPYDRATTLWVTSVAFALLLAGIFTLVAAVMRKPRRAVVGAIVAVLLAPSLGLLVSCPQLDWCRTGVEQSTGLFIDDGQGG
jgi:predicted cobalt transporter CbtA